MENSKSIRLGYVTKWKVHTHTKKKDKNKIQKYHYARTIQPFGMAHPSFHC